jgi:small subunit ribosomal protein S20
MAHTAQQRKRIRQDTARNAANTSRRSKLKTTLKGFDAAVAKGDKEGIAAGFKAAMSALAKSASKGIISKSAAARKVSRLAARIAGK